MTHTEPTVVWYAGGQIYTGDPDHPRAESLVTRGRQITYVGPDTDAAEHAGPEATRIELDGATVLPGFVDGHAHVLMTGQAQLAAPLTDATELAAIQRRITHWADEHPDAARVLGRGWLYQAVPGGDPTAAMLDAAVPDRPVYLDANDYHSVWVNSAALAELGITCHTPDPVGGRIARDATTGEPTGHLIETVAQHQVWPFLAERTSDADRDAALTEAVTHYLASGVTCAVDMGLDEHSLATMLRAEHAGTLPLRIIGHWLIHRSADSTQHHAQIARAAELAATHHSENLRVAGVKFILDGVIDGCTAALLEPYANGTQAEPIWSFEELAPAVAAADAAGLQIAMHAIGDQATRIALDALEHAYHTNGPRERRHRIEHLEYVDPADVDRLARLGVTASMQPVHADAAIRDNWNANLGPERAARGFAWPEFTDTGAHLALGTDTPTAPHHPLPNLYMATTRASALNPERAPQQPHYALPLAAALHHATADSAWACHQDTTLGMLTTGRHADFVVLEHDPFAHDSTTLLHTTVLRTVVDGQTVWQP